MSTSLVVNTPGKTRSKLRTLGRFLIRFFALPYVCVCALLGMVQRQLMYPARVVSASDVELAVQDDKRIRPLSITTFDNLSLQGFVFGRAEVDVGDNRGLEGPVLLYFPGNGGCRIDRLDNCECFAGLGFNVVLFDYRGYGENPGKPSEESIVRDAHSIWDHLTKQLNIPGSQIVLYGESLGGAVATRLAADLGRNGTSPAGLFVSSSFSSMVETAAWHYPFLPVRLLLFDRYESHNHVCDVTCPIVMVHGTHDEIVPLALGERLFSRATPVSLSGIAKRFIEIPGARHNDVPLDAICGALQSLVETNPMVND